MTTNSFTDTEGRRWSFEVNVFTVQRVQRETGLNLLGLTDLAGDTMTRLASDVVVLFDVMASLLQDQLQERDVSPEEFGRALDERAANEATKALVTAVLGFFQPAKAGTLTTAFEKVWTASERATNEAAVRIAAVVDSREFDRAVGDAMETILDPVGPGGGSSS